MCSCWEICPASPAVALFVLCCLDTASWTTRCGVTYISRVSLPCLVNQSALPSCLSSSRTLHLFPPLQLPFHSTSFSAYISKKNFRREDNAGRACHVTCQTCSHLLTFLPVRLNGCASQTTTAVSGRVGQEGGRGGRIRMLHCSLDRLPRNRPPGRGWCIPLTPRTHQGYWGLSVG